jgi:hypothetical protein
MVSLFGNAVLSLTPGRNELAGLHMPGHARGTISLTFAIETTREQEARSESRAR